MDPNEAFSLTADSNLEEVLQREYKVDSSIPCVSPVSEFFANKTIFLTGPTGFLGHLLLEKLLR